MTTVSGLYSLQDLKLAIATNPGHWRPLVLTNGCFDLLHTGHVRYLQAAKALGRTLVVGLNSDASVRQLKPPKAGLPPRPLIPENQRAEVLAALKSVDGVVIFEEKTAVHLIKTLRPDIYAKGGDYQRETLPEWPALQALGCQVSFIPLEILSSTSAIIQHILQHHQSS